MYMVNVTEKMMERWRDRNNYTYQICVCVYIYIYICMYVYEEREYTLNILNLRYHQVTSKVKFKRIIGNFKIYSSEN